MEISILVEIIMVLLELVMVMEVAVHQEEVAELKLAEMVLVVLLLLNGKRRI
jgi:hypothetical protein